MAVNQPFTASVKAMLRLVGCIACCMLFAGSYAQDDTSQTVPKHIYDSSERFFNRKLAEDAPFYIDHLPKNKDAEHALAQLKKDKAFWYVDAIEKLQGKKALYRHLFDSLNKARKPVPDEQLLDEDEGFAGGSAMRMLLWILIIGILAFALVYFLTANKISLFSRKDIVSKSGNDAGGHGVNIFESRFEEMLSKAAAEKNFRLMTRILYLQTLRMLSDKNLIRYNQSYTNLEYLHQMHPTEHYLDFFTITRHYEYVWYGKFELNEPVYRQIENAIRSFQKRIA